MDQPSDEERGVTPAPMLRAHANRADFDAAIDPHALAMAGMLQDQSAEALNGFNSPYFYSPNTNLSSGQFGQINSQANFARQLQLAIRFTF